MRLSIRCLATLILLAGAASGDTLPIDLTRTSGDFPYSAEIGDRWLPDEGADRIEVTCLDANDEPVTPLPDTAIALVGDDGTEVARFAVTGSDEKFLAPADLHGLRIFLIVGDERLRVGNIPPRSAAPPATPLASAADAGPQFLKDLRRTSRDWLKGRGVTEHPRDGGAFGDTWTLYHLADGSLAFPPPRHLAEEDEIVLRVAVPVGGRADFEILSCGEVPAIRVRGDYKTAGELVGEFQTAREPAFEFVDYEGGELQCAESLGYRITVHLPGSTGSEELPATTTTLRIEPVYLFSWSVGYGFDFGRRPAYELVEREGAGGEIEKVVAERRDRHGDLAMLVLQLHPFKANPRDWTIRDFLLSPFVALDPDRLDEGFVVGNAFSPVPGLNLLVGLGIFEQQKLPEQLDLEDGDVWNVPGELPTHTVYGGSSNGWVLGVTFSTEVFGALKGR